MKDALQINFTYVLTSKKCSLQIREYIEGCQCLWLMAAIISAFCPHPKVTYKMAGLVCFLDGLCSHVCSTL